MASRTRRTIRKKNQTRKSFPTPGPSQCHPRVGMKRPAHGCLPVNILQRAAKKVGLEPGQRTPVTLRHALEKRLSVETGNEYSFVNALPLTESEKEYLKTTYLRPEKPAKWNEDPDMWLDSTNIENVMKQYEDAYSNFEFMGPFPIDFAAPDPYKPSKDGKQNCLIQEICSLRVAESMKNGTQYIGIIYNLDPHFKDGSHWVANFIDIPRHKCYYFDSYGYEPPKQVSRFMKWLTTQDPKMSLGYNAHRFQHKDSECGMYSLYFIIRMLMGDEFKPFCRREPPDSTMLEFRNWLFST
jgi:hypothetical protein